MAAGTMPKPGTEYGPCADECVHTDCAAHRKIAEAECVHCDEAIGYDTRFYHVDTIRQSGADWPGTRVYAHARCVET
jgi:hypothetical protein